VSGSSAASAEGDVDVNAVAQQLARMMRTEFGEQMGTLRADVGSQLQEALEKQKTEITAEASESVSVSSPLSSLIDSATK